jgi:peptidoglycan/LPS O-acetylase OafA/YrhL
MNALSLPTWVIHISSVLEWMAAIWFVWLFAMVTQRPVWRWLAIGMLPSLISAMAACTWHFFDNDPDYSWLVTLQAAMTVIGNTTLCLAAWWIWRQQRRLSTPKL